MLQYTAIDAPTLELLKRLMDEPAFNGLRLVGGTALSLQLGHRVSVDIDLFSDCDYGSIDFGIAIVTISSFLHPRCSLLFLFSSIFACC